MSQIIGDLIVSGNITVYGGGITAPISGSSTSASYALTASYIAGGSTSASWASQSLSSSYAITSSYTRVAQTASLLAGTASHAISSSIARTASYVQTAQSASYVATAITASYALAALTASFAVSYSVNSVTQSNVLSASFASSSLTASYVEVAKTASYVQIAQSASFVEAAVSSSYVSGSNVIGTVDSAYSASQSDTIGVSTFDSDIDSFVTLANVKGVGGVGLGAGTLKYNAFQDKVTVNKAVIAQLTGSLDGTASFANTATTSDSSTTSVTASYVQTAQTASYVVNADTASYVNLAKSASYVSVAKTASYALFSLTGLTATSASYVSTAQTASYVVSSLTASYVATAQTASYVVSALTASYVATAQTASWISGSNVKGTVSSSVSASLAETASYMKGYFAQGILGGNQSIANSSDTVISFVDQYDPYNWYDATTKKVTPTIPGYYQVAFGIWLDNPATSSGQTNAQARKNGVTHIIVQYPLNNGTGQSLAGSKIVQMNGTTDYIDFTMYQNSGGARNILQGNADGSGTWFTITLISR